MVSWDKNIPSLNGILRKYEIRWKKVDSHSTDYHNETLIIEEHNSRRRREIRIPSNRTFFELKNLSLYTNYSVEVAAVTIKVGAYSSPKYFMTGEGGRGIDSFEVTEFCAKVIRGRVGGAGKVDSPTGPGFKRLGSLSNYDDDDNF